MRPLYVVFPRTARVLRAALRPFLDYDMAPRTWLVKWGAAACIVKYLCGG